MLIQRKAITALSLILIAAPVGAAEREIIHTDWSGFQKQVSALGLKGRAARVSAGGKTVKTSVLDFSDTELVVRATRGTKQWGAGSGQVKIPKDEVVSVRFEGRTGKGRLIGSLAGFGAGSGIAAGAISGSEISEGVGVILLPVAGVGIAVGGAVAGYFIGRSMDKPLPEFVLTK